MLPNALLAKNDPSSGNIELPCIVFYLELHRTSKYASIESPF
jgi:hypothetical protein